jgi:hypothetical protein
MKRVTHGKPVKKPATCPRGFADRESKLHPQLAMRAIFSGSIPHIMGQGCQKKHHQTKGITAQLMAPENSGLFIRYLQRATRLNMNRKFSFDFDESGQTL